MISVRALDDVSQKKIRMTKYRKDNMDGRIMESLYFMFCYSETINLAKLYLEATFRLHNHQRSHLTREDQRDSQHRLRLEAHRQLAVALAFLPQITCLQVPNPKIMRLGFMIGVKWSLTLPLPSPFHPGEESTSLLPITTGGQRV